MKRFLSCLCIAIALSAPAVSQSSGLSPWEFGMSKQKVSSFSKYGPFKTFSNGDLETYDGYYDGKKENIQFFFDNNGLGRIGVYLYEGTDPTAARNAWRRAYDSLEKKYGKIDTPELKVKAGSEPVNSEILSIAAAANVDVTGKVQMAPARQPQGMFVFSSFFQHDIQGGRYYYVTIYFDRPN